jgi:diguanylate cyclase (GGDEF)-like protein
MTPPNIAYSAALMVGGITCLVTSLIILQTRRNSLGAIPLMVLMAALSWWDLTYSLFWAGAPAPYPNFWLYITFLGAVIVPAALLTFAIQLSEIQHWLKWPFLLGLSIEPLFVILFLFTDSGHGLFFGGEQTHSIGMIITSGPIYWANIVYSYLLVLIACLLLIRRFNQTSGIYRKQLGTILVGIAIPWINSIIFIFGLSPFPNADNTPFSFTFGGLIFSYALLRYHLLDIIPIARYVLIESMSDGVIVLDAQNRLVDLNPAARQMLDSSHPLKIGEPVETVLSLWPNLTQTFVGVNEIRAEVSIGDPPQTYLDLKISPLLDAQHSMIGRLVIWRDITPLKKAQTELQELATKDSLTGTFNRRYFLEIMDKEIQRAIRFRHPLTIILLDVDSLKSINDTFGHLAGDQALKSVVDIFRMHIRDIDLFARFGGDEFIVLLPEADSRQTQLTAERMIQALIEHPVEFETERLNVTVSMGISGLRDERDTPETIFHRADQALYAAKGTGKNHIMIWNESMLLQDK